VSKADYSEFPLLGKLDADEFSDLEKSIVSITLPPDAMVLEALPQPFQYRFLNEWAKLEENNVTPLYLLESGKVMLSRKYRHHTFEVTTLGDGEVFGESSHLFQQVGGSQFRTVETSRIHIVPSMSVAPLIKDNQKFRHSLEQLAERRLTSTVVAVHPAFSLLPQSIREIILYNAEYISLDSDETLVSQGQQHGDWMYLILSGSARITAKHPNDDSEVVLAIESSGKELGDIAVITGQPHPVTIRASTPLRLLGIRSASIKAWRERHSDFAHMMDIIVDDKQAGYSNTILNACSS